MDSLGNYCYTYCKLILPLFAYYFCFFIQASISTAMISRKYNDNDLVNGIGLSNLYLNCTTMCVLLGLTTGVETLSSNAVGNKDYYLAGVYACRGKHVLFFFLTLLAGFHFLAARSIFEFCGISPSTIHQTLRYMWCAVPSYYIASSNFVDSRLVSILGYAWVSTVAGVISLCLQPFFCYFLVFTLDLGVVGAGLSQNFTFLVLFAVYKVWFTRFCPYSEVNLSMFDKNVLKDFSRYLEVGLPNTLLLAAKWWAAEIQALFALYMSPTDYTVYIITFVFHTLLISYTLSCAIGNIILIAKAFGDEKKRGTDVLAILRRNQAFSILTTGILFFIVWSFKNEIAFLYSNNPVVAKEIADCLCLVMLHVMLDSVNENFETTAKAINDQKVPTAVGTLVYYSIQCSISYLVGIRLKYGVKGIWCGFIAASLVMNIFFFFFITTRDYEKLKRNSLCALKKNQEELVEYEPVSTRTT